MLLLCLWIVYKVWDKGWDLGMGCVKEVMLKVMCVSQKEKEETGGR
jgi:hypothetical protein